VSRPERWQQIEKLYHAAVGLAPAERERMFSAADPELRREVESLLAQDASKTGALDDPSQFLDTLTISLPIGVGAQLGPYVIESRLGEGGMGEV
jgi:hypothetical protein